MFCVKHLLGSDKSRIGRIVNIKDIWRSIDLVQNFGARRPLRMKAEMAPELADDFFVNDLFDKETYYSFRFQ